MLVKDIKRFFQEHNVDDNLSLVIYLSEDSLGPTPFSEVEFASVGFDWDSGKLFLKPKYDLVINRGKDVI